MSPVHPRPAGIYASGVFDDERLEVTMREALKLNWTGASVWNLNNKRSKKP